MDLTPVTDGSRGFYGRVEAVNMLTREVLWRERHRAPVSSAIWPAG